MTKQSFPNWHVLFSMDAAFHTCQPLLPQRSSLSWRRILLSPIFLAWARWPQEMDFAASADLPWQPSGLLQWHCHTFIIASHIDHNLQGQCYLLIPLYAIGVFLSFTLSQTGMAKRWWKIGHLKEGEEIISQDLHCDTTRAGGSKCSSMALARYVRQSSWLCLR